MVKTEKEILHGMTRFKFDLLCYIDFKFFCERMLGLVDMGGIHDFQLKWIKIIEKNRVIMIEAPSGSSKSEIVGACYPLWMLYRNPNKKIEIRIVSKTIAQSEKNLLIRMQNYILDNEILRKSFVPSNRRVSWTKTGFRTINGSVADIVPFNINIKGSRAHLMILDEIDSYEDPDIFFKHVLSRTHADGKTIGISTPESVSNIIGKLKEKKGSKVAFYKTAVFVNPDGTNVQSEKVQTADDFERLEKLGCKSIWTENKKFSFEYMREDFITMGRYSWIQNYLCEILGYSEDAAFPLKNIVDSYDSDLNFNYEVNKHAMYFLGADFATSAGAKADFDGFTVLELLNGVYTLKHIQKGKGIHPETKVRELKRLYEIFSKGLTCKIVADESNVGNILIKMIRAAGCTVIPQKFTGAARWQLIQAASNILSSGFVRIPKNPEQQDYNRLVDELQTQLSGFIRAKTEKGNETFLSKAAHDDLAISLCMAISEASKQITTYARPQSA